MEQKNIVATIYLKDGKAVKSPTDFTPDGDLFERAKIYNDCGIDKIIIFDLSEDDEEHEKNLKTIKDLNHNLEIKVCAGGNINRFEDIKKIFYILQAVAYGVIVDKKGFCRASDRAVMMVVAEKRFKVFRAVFLIVAL